MKKVLSTVFLVVYSVIAIATTILLLSYNEYRCSEIGGYTFLIMSDDSLEPEYEKGDLLIVEASSERTIEPGDEVFAYITISKSEYNIVCEKVVNKTYQGTKALIELESGVQIEYKSVIGEKEDVQVFENLGTFLGILESKWGYLFLIVIVSLFLFLQEAFELYMELRYGNVEETKEK